MSQIIIDNGNVAEWRKLVHDGELDCEIELGEELQSYLVFLLMRHVEKPEIINRIMALELTNSLVTTGRAKQTQLRDVGDCCLLFSGFFPQIAEKRRVDVSYYVGMGQSAYLYLAESCHAKMSPLFYCVSEGFVHLMEVLQAIRSFEHESLLSPLQAFDLWQNAGSAQAFKSICENSNAVPVFNPGNNKH